MPKRRDLRQERSLNAKNTDLEEEMGHHKSNRDNCKMKEQEWERKEELGSFIN
jgi:hypothetical protein